MNSRSGRRLKLRLRTNGKHGIIICQGLPGRFPNAVEYRPEHRSTKNTGTECTSIKVFQGAVWTCI